MAACFYFMRSVLSEELGVGSLPQVWDGGGGEYPAGPGAGGFRQNHVTSSLNPLAPCDL